VSQKCGETDAVVGDVSVRLGNVAARFEGPGLEQLVAVSAEFIQQRFAALAMVVQALLRIESRFFA
jgi:hypothetical protein